MNESTTLLDQFDRRLIDSLYVEAMVLADEARSYFDHHANAQRAVLGQQERLDFACEALKVTTRLMHVIAWLLTQRAIVSGELPGTARHEACNRLGEATATDAAIAKAFSFDMMTLILASEDLYGRVARLEGQMLGLAGAGAADMRSPARELLTRLERAF